MAAADDSAVLVAARQLAEEARERGRREPRRPRRPVPAGPEGEARRDG
jgi:hypothetical protein